MIHLLAVGSGTNLKNGKPISFTVTEATSRKGLAENVLIKHMVVIQDTSHEKIAELIRLKTATASNELGIRRTFALPELHPYNQIRIILAALLKACVEEGMIIAFGRHSSAGDILKTNVLDIQKPVRNDYTSALGIEENKY